MRASLNLLYNLVRRDLTVRYKSTVLGFFWSFIKPLAMTAIFFVVFDKILHLDLREGERIPLALHMLAGILPWTFFAGATGEAMTVILANANLIKKVRLPLVVFPMATVCSHLVHFILALMVLVGLLIFLAGLPPTAAYLWLIPLIAVQCLLTLAVAMLLAALNVFFRDVSSIWEVLTTAWFYATPIIYPAYYVSERLRAYGGWLAEWGEWLYLLNPLTPLVLAYRQALIYASLDAPAAAEMPGIPLLPAVGLSLAISLILLWFSRKIFDHYSRMFADEL
jgi:ABC-2 type transport system permease protein